MTIFIVAVVCLAIGFVLGMIFKKPVASEGDALKASAEAYAEKVKEEANSKLGKL